MDIKRIFTQLPPVQTSHQQITEGEKQTPGGIAGGADLLEHPGNFNALAQALGDAATDVDGDGIPNALPDVVEDDPTDLDKDAIPNALVEDAVASDPLDLDQDAIPNSPEEAIANQAPYDVEDRDVDGDGMLNAADPDIGNDGRPDEFEDIDNDGVRNPADPDV